MTYYDIIIALNNQWTVKLQNRGVFFVVRDKSNLEKVELVHIL